MSRRVAIPTLALLMAAPCVALQLDVQQLATSRVDDDLHLTWSATTDAPEGYRVYLARGLDCRFDLVHEGPETTYVAAGEFTRSDFGMWKVTAFAGSEEGSFSPPAMRFQVAGDRPTPVDPSISLPYLSSVTDAEQLCLELAREGSTVVSVASLGLNETRRTHWCGQGDSFPLLPGEAPLVVASGWFNIYGSSPRSWTFDLHPGSWGTRYWLSLPYDHAYHSLSEIAAELPSAREVKNWDLMRNDFIGLVKDSPLLPWAGVDVDSSLSRGLGLQVQLTSPTVWTPARRCDATRPPQRRMSTLLATKASAGVGLWWEPQDLAQSYEVHWLRFRERINDTGVMTPYLTVPGPRPNFPVVDGPLTGRTFTIYYQVRAVDDAGTLDHP